MQASMNFRTALSGFNREDVVHFIEYLNAKHTAEANQLKAEVDQLRAELNLLRSQESAQSEEETGRLEALQDENDRLNQQIASLNAELAMLNNQQLTADPTDQAEKEQLQAELDQLRMQYDALKAEKENPSNVARELEAYRRAERTERLARERAELVYHQVNGVLADATARVEDASAQLGDLTDRISEQLNQLQAAVIGSRQALTDASATLGAIRPTGENF